MKIVRFRNLRFIPASHEDQKNPGVLKKVLFEKDDLIDGRIQMINWAKLPKGKFFELHYHQDMDEVFIILSGKAKLRVGEKEVTLEKGDAVIAPMKKIQQMTNIGSNDVEYIVLGISTGQGGKTMVLK